MKSRLMYMMPSCLLPVTIHLYICGRNSTLLEDWFIAMSTIAVLAMATMFYLFVFLLNRDDYTTSTFCICIWIGSYFQPCMLSGVERLLSMIMKDAGRLRGKNTLITLFIIAIGMLLTVHLKKISNRKEKVLLSATTICLLFIINLSMLLIKEFGVGGSAEERFTVKTEYEMDSDTNTPNIYWFHPDGMLGFAVFEKYFSDPQEEFKKALSKRGFSLYEDANFEAAHSTSVAVPELMNPDAYDQWISPHTITHETAMERFATPKNLHYLDSLKDRAEMITAFGRKGYTVNVCGHPGYYYPPQDGYIWPTAAGYREVVRYSRRMKTALSLHLMLSDMERVNTYYYVVCSGIDSSIGRILNWGDMMPYQSEIPKEKLQEIIIWGDADDLESFGDVISLYDVLNGGYSQPRLTIIHNCRPHFPFIFDEYGNRRGEESKDPWEYYAQHKYCAKVLINMIDMILEKEPNAVIMIQSDHGLHGNTKKEFREAFGEGADCVELWNSTISASRIPKKYLSGDEKYLESTPLNFSRYLVNSYVGRNYRYRGGK